MSTDLTDTTALEKASFDDLVRLVRGISRYEIGRYALAHKELKALLHGFRPDHPEKFPKPLLTRVARFVQNNPPEKTGLMKMWLAHNDGLRNRLKESVRPHSIEEDLLGTLSGLDLRDDTLPDRVFWVLILDERQELHQALGEDLLQQVADGNSALWLRIKNAHLLTDTKHLQGEIDRLKKELAEAAKRGERERRRSQSEKAGFEGKVTDLRRALNDEKEHSRDIVAKAAKIPALLEEQLERERKRAAETADQLKSMEELYEQERVRSEQLKTSFESEKQARERDHETLSEMISQNAQLKDEIESLRNQPTPPSNLPLESRHQLTDVISAWSRAVSEAAAAIDNEKAVSTDQQSLEPTDEWTRWQASESGFVKEFLYPNDGL